MKFRRTAIVLLTSALGLVTPAAVLVAPSALSATIVSAPDLPGSIPEVCAWVNANCDDIPCGPQGCDVASRAVD